MKTLPTILVLFLFSQLATAQYSQAPFEKEKAKNSISLEYSSAFGNSLRFDRVLYAKGNFSLVGQAGIGVKFDRPNFYHKRHVALALYGRVNFGDHNIELGGGVDHAIKKYDRDVFRPLVLETWNRTAYAHLAYSLRPLNKNWFLKLSADPIINSSYELKPNFSIGGGFSF